MASLDGSDISSFSLKHIWNVRDILSARGAQVVELMSSLDVPIAGLFFRFDFSTICKELLNCRWLHHEVNLVAAWSTELDWSDRDVAIEVSPLVSNSFVGLKHTAVKFDEGLRNDWLVLALSALHAHHGWKRAASGSPVAWVAVSEVLDTGHVSIDSLAEEDSSVQSKSIAVGRVEVGWQSASSFVTKEVTLWVKLTLVSAVVRADFELLLQKQDQELLSVDLGHLHVTVRVSVEEQLLGDGRGQELEESLR